MTEHRDELSMPHFEDRLWGELEALHRDRSGRVPVPVPVRGPDRRLRRQLMMAGAGAVAAAVVVVAMLWAPTMSGDDRPAGDARSPSAGAAAPLDPNVDVVQRVLAATAVPGQSIVHTAVVTGGGYDNTESWYDQVSAAKRVRTTTADGDPLTDSGWPDPPAVDAEPHPGAPAPGPRLDHCDPATKLTVDAQGRISGCETGVVPPSNPDHAYRSVDHCRKTYREGTAPVAVDPGTGYLDLYLGTGHIVQDGTEVVEGREWYRLRNGNGTYVWLVDPDTFLPVRMTSVPGADPDATYLDSNGEPTDPPPSSVTTYEYLPRTGEHLAKLQVPVPDGYEKVEADRGPEQSPEAVELEAPGRPGPDGRSTDACVGNHLYSLGDGEGIAGMSIEVPDQGD